MSEKKHFSENDIAAGIYTYSALKKAEAEHRASQGAGSDIIDLFDMGFGVGIAGLGAILIGVTFIMGFLFPIEFLWHWCMKWGFRLLGIGIGIELIKAFFKWLFSDKK